MLSRTAPGQPGRTVYANALRPALGTVDPLSRAFQSPEQLLRLAALDPWLPQSCHPCKTSDSENYMTRIHEQPSLECFCLPQVSGSKAASVVGDRRRVRAGACLQPLRTRGFENLRNCPWASELGHLAQPAVNLRLFCFLCLQV